MMVRMLRMLSDGVISASSPPMSVFTQPGFNTVTTAPRDVISFARLAIAMWVFFLAWRVLCWAAFLKRETDRGLALTKIDEKIRFVFIPVILVVAVSSLMGYGPFEAGDMQKWFSAKVLVFSFLLMIGLKLRFIMREWTELFRMLAMDPGNRDAEATLEKSLRVGRGLAYVYWVGIATVAFFGAVKPF